MGHIGLYDKQRIFILKPRVAGHSRHALMVGSRDQMACSGTGAIDGCIST